MDVFVCGFSHQYSFLLANKKASPAEAGLAYKYGSWISISYYALFASFGICNTLAYKFFIFVFTNVLLICLVHACIFDFFICCSIGRSRETGYHQQGKDESKQCLCVHLCVVSKSKTGGHAATSRSVFSDLSAGIFKVYVFPNTNKM
jgi:hypothetical protein